MGSDGFRVVRIAFMNDWNPKKFLEMQRRNPVIKPEEYDFVKDHLNLVSDLGLEAFRGITVAHKGETISGVDLTRPLPPTFPLLPTLALQRPRH